MIIPCKKARPPLDNGQVAVMLEQFSKNVNATRRALDETDATIRAILGSVLRCIGLRIKGNSLGSAVCLDEVNALMNGVWVYGQRRLGWLHRMLCSQATGTCTRRGAISFSQSGSLDWQRWTA
jgi:hypothetical protein